MAALKLLLFLFAIRAVVAVGRLVALCLLWLRRFAARLLFCVVRFAFFVSLAKRLIALIAGSAACASAFIVITPS